MQDARQIVRKHLIEAKNKSKQAYDKNVHLLVIKLNDKVLMKNMKRKNKLEPNWLGSFEVIEINESVNVTIIKNNKHVRVHMNHLKLYKKESE
ncbi:zinc finger BED domain-containing protein 1-like [Aphis craccivora]|uniref:Zinc finger BED domain-containing protein 1-like n=1 Tax=Aphis craccivora TaxID=307492 RepID=A0A6G0W3S1_APHCR|nr:zinc finger BED domain-containing protein 1-like [Aphis craccivora]